MRKTFTKLTVCLMLSFLLAGFTNVAAADLQAKLAAGKLAQKVDAFEVIFDSTLSMNDMYKSNSKLNQEKSVVTLFNNTIPNMRITAAARAFGQFRPFGDTTTKLLYGPGMYSKSDLPQALATFKEGSGFSPLDAALDGATVDLQSQSGQLAVIAFSDGEDMEKYAPVASAQKLKSAYGGRVCIYTVHLGESAAGRKIMQQVADAGQCGFAINADEIATADSMENYIEKVFFTTAKAKCLDRDNDGVCDDFDKCPGTPFGVKVNSDGCPIDSDGDGVPDYLDKCPDTPKGVTVDKYGCPPVEVKVEEAAPVKEAAPEVVSMTLLIVFDTGKSNIKPQYNNEIKKVADFMKKYPETKMEIQGHTDNVGKEAANVKLSQARANSVMKYLITKFGIAKERLTAVGYGPKKPVASNATKEGKQKNRRVEAVIQTTVNK